MTRRTLQIETTAPRVITLTTRAAAKVKELAASEGNPDAALRFEVQPGGCAGFRYGLFFDDQIGSDDLVEDFEGVRVVCDPLSAPYVRGVVIDWVESLSQSGFQIQNPNAQGSCACGDSFR